MDIAAPKHRPDDPDYTIHCEEALDLAVLELIDKAVQAGWESQTVYVALTSVAMNRSKAYEEDPDPADG